MADRAKWGQPATAAGHRLHQEDENGTFSLAAPCD